MGTRRKGREGALQILYQLEAFAEEKREDLPRGVKAPKTRVLHTVARDVDNAISDFFENFDADERAKSFTTDLVQGVVAHAAALDDTIRAASPKWRIERMGMVDRNVLRLASFEFVHRTEVPTRVIIDEAIEIARRYGSEDSASFVNGVLDTIGRSTRPAKSSEHAG